MRRGINGTTFFLHVDLEAFLEPARLALVPAGDIHDAVSAFFANIIQVPGGGANINENMSAWQILSRLTWLPASECFF